MGNTGTHVVLRPWEAVEDIPKTKGAVKEEWRLEDRSLGNLNSEEAT